MLLCNKIVIHECIFYGNIFQGGVINDSAHPRLPPAAAPHAGEQDAALAGSKSRPGFYLKLCRGTRVFITDDTTARHPPPVGGG